MYSIPAAPRSRSVHWYQSLLNRILPARCRCVQHKTHINKCEKRGKNGSQITPVAQLFWLDQSASISKLPVRWRNLGRPLYDPRLGVTRKNYRDPEDSKTTADVLDEVIRRHQRRRSAGPAPNHSLVYPLNEILIKRDRPLWSGHFGTVTDRSWPPADRLAPPNLPFSATDPRPSASGKSR